jgi:long-subunit fatty acid transport protein
LNRWFNGFRQTRERVEGRPSDQVVNFDLSGWNFNLGAIWSPRPELNLALAGRTQFTGKVALDRTRIDFPSPDHPQTTTNGFSSEEVRLDFPGAFGVGASWRPRSTLTLSADYTRTFWSSASIHNFFTLPITGQPLPPDDLFPELPYPTLESEQTDTEQFRFGFEYVVLGKRVKVPLRFGLFSDRQYFRAADGSIPRFLGFTVGGGVLVGPILFDIAYLYEDGSYSGGSGTEAGVRIRRFYASLIYRHQAQP